MQTRETSKSAGEEPNTPRKFLTLFIVGFSTMIVGLILVAVAAIVSQGGSTSSGGIIFIGPIPIVFGAGPGAQWMILFATILAVLTVIMLLMLRRKPSSTRV
jgi:uncharacterized membrane protein